MKRFIKCLNCTKKSLLQIHLVDKCLILFMCVLLAQSAFSLFHPVTLSKESGDIDIIIRTSSAAIFGYFISANFIRRFSHKENARKTPPSPQEEPTTAQSKDLSVPISANASADMMPEKSLQEEAVKEEDLQEESSANRLQIIAATAIGLFCLIILLIQRNFQNADLVFINTSSTAATIAQFRDFVSGCVGFLIGTPTHRAP